MFWFPRRISEQWTMSGIRSVVNMAPGQRTLWCHRDISSAFVTLSRSGGLRNVTKQVMMGGCSLQVTGVGNPESGRKRLTETAIAVRLPHDQHHPVWAGVCVLASCGMNSRIFPWFICFLSPLFWNLNAGDKRGPNDPFVWATTPASRQASLGNERLHLHIINGIHTSRHQSVQDDQELSGSYHRCMALVIYLCLLILTNAAGTGPGPANVAPAAHVTCHRP